jgi:hypothetical protein
MLTAKQRTDECLILALRAFWDVDHGPYAWQYGEPRRHHYERWRLRGEASAHLSNAIGWASR